MLFCVVWRLYQSIKKPAWEPKIFYFLGVHFAGVLFLVICRHIIRLFEITQTTLGRVIFSIRITTTQRLQQACFADFRRTTCYSASQNFIDIGR